MIIDISKKISSLEMEIQEKDESVAAVKRDLDNNNALSEIHKQSLDSKSTAVKKLQVCDLS